MFIDLSPVTLKLGDIDVDGKTILKLNLKKHAVKI
jgi:hypothetical protein